MEIVTWVLDGSLVHQDSTGTSGVIYPGLAQRMSAGTGILHSEKNDSWRVSGGPEHSDPVHFVQMWVVPDEGGLTPGYEQLEIDGELLSGGAGDRSRPAWPSTTAPPPSASTTGTPRSTPPASSPARASSCPRHRYLHLFVPRGGVSLGGRRSAGRGRRRALHRHRRPARDRHRASRDPGLGDARRAWGLNLWRGLGLIQVLAVVRPVVPGELLRGIIRTFERARAMTGREGTASGVHDAGSHSAERRNALEQW